MSIDRERETRIYRHLVLIRENPTTSQENPICGMCPVKCVNRLVWSRPLRLL